MKKLYLFLLLLTEINFNAKAQFVPIPDANFRTWLNTHGYSQCMSGNQMDTNCQAIVSVLGFAIGSANIADLTGIQYFDSLQLLDCSSSQLSSIPALPPRLTRLTCAGTQLTSLPGLPAGLIHLDCWSNQLITLPAMPVGLIDLNCGNNQLSSLPSMPPGLVELRCYGNLLDSLPPLPNSLNTLQCENNQLTWLPPLSGTSLIQLLCDHNQLVSIPAVPQTLETLVCSHNLLVSLPDLPLEMYSLGCDSNQITQLPPLRGVIGLDISNNPISCVPSLQLVGTFNFLNTSITCLPNYIMHNIYSSNPRLESLPLCDMSNVNGCAFDTACLGTCVWPGDADFNGLADNNDLLSIGLGYGTTGYVRMSQVISWTAHTAVNWDSTKVISCSGIPGSFTLRPTPTFAYPDSGMFVSGSGIAYGAVVDSLYTNGTNDIALSTANTGPVSGPIIFTTTRIDSKHRDCNGDGIVNADDTVAILQNFGQVHAKTDEGGGWRSTDPALYVDLTPDTTRAGDTLYALLSLGDINIPASDIYGLAFTLHYDPIVVDSSKTHAIFGNSWLGTSADKISIAKDLKPTGEMKCALTRIDHTTRSGFGQIGQVEFVITTDNINGKDLAYYQMNVWISDLVMIDNLGNYITVNAGSDSSLVEFEPLSVGNQELAIRNFKIQPNPANDAVLILVNNNLIGGEINLSDMEGRTLIGTAISASKIKLQISNFANGIYFLRLRTDAGILTRRLVITHP